MTEKDDKKLAEDSKEIEKEHELSIREIQKLKRQDNVRKARESRLSFLESHPELRKVKKKTLKEKEREIEELKPENTPTPTIKTPPNKETCEVPDELDEIREIKAEITQPKKKEKLTRREVELLLEKQKLEVENKLLKEFEERELKKKELKRLKKQTKKQDEISNKLEKITNTTTTNRKKMIGNRLYEVEYSLRD